jgi:hypothetical protein
MSQALNLNQHHLPVISGHPQMHKALVATTNIDDTRLTNELPVQVISNSQILHAMASSCSARSNVLVPTCQAVTDTYQSIDFPQQHNF